MVKWHLYLSVAATAVVATSGWAADTLQFAAPDTWVKPVAFSESSKAEPGAPVAVLNVDNQIRFGPDGDDIYTEFVVRIQTPQGLTAARPYAVWNPQTDSVVVHKVHLIRNGQVIDVLAGGQTFTTLRREENLDSSMLDGQLTAVLQPEGVQVGDILDYSMTLHRADPVMRGNSESLLFSRPQVAIGRISYRVLWPKSKVVRWRASDDIKDARLAKTPEGSELTLNLVDYKMPEAQERLPTRFARTGELEFSQFTSWHDLSAILAPLYAKAATLAVDSPLKAEAAKIRALSNDPKVQAAAALNLVEDQVRYVFIGANQGGYVPADADATWTRRFGDCKGKSVLLVALLRELGIEAEAAAVSTWAGDGMDHSLPLIELFDHVIVRATIAGKVYWMDGTRLGDGTLDLLSPPPYQWALLLPPGGGDLTAIEMPPPAKPLEETLLKFDASGGLDAPAPVQVDFIMRGDAAIDLHNKLLAQTPGDLDTGLKAYWAQVYSWITVDTVGQAFDAATGELRMTMAGKADMAWDSPGMGKPRQYAVDGDFIGGGFGLKRKDGPNADAPVTLPYPRFEKTIETIILPQGGKGFSIAGDAVDTTLAGYVMKRSLSLANGVFTMEVTQHTLDREVPVNEVNAAEAELIRMGKATVHVQAPYDYAATESDIKTASAAEPKTAAEFMARGVELALARQYDKAIADYDAALKLDPKSAKAMALRGNARAAKKDYDAAFADYDAAVALDRRDTTAWYGRAYAWYDTHDYAKAVDAVTHLLTINPADNKARKMRAQLYLEQGDKEGALDDALAASMMEPDSVDSATFLARIYDANNKSAEAVATLRTALVKSPEEADLHAALARHLEYCAGGTSAKDCFALRKEALAEFDRAIALAPTVGLYVERASARPMEDRAAKFADLDQAFLLQPDGPGILVTRAGLLIYYKEYDKAAADIATVLAADPRNVDALFAHASLMDARGDIDAEIADNDAVLALEPDNSQYLNNACWVRATHKRDLDKALANCDASLKLKPNSAATFDSRGLVHLQRAEWDLALADYNAAITAEGKFGSALFGRGIAELRLGKTEAGNEDIASAKALYAGIDKKYAGYGIKP